MTIIHLQHLTGNFMKKALFGLSIVFLAFLGGCGPSEKAMQSLARSATVSAALEREFGQKPFVIARYRDKKLLAVIVRFAEPHPNASHQALANFTMPLVTSEFKQEPEKLKFEFVATLEQ